MSSAAIARRLLPRRRDQLADGDELPEANAQAELRHAFVVLDALLGGWDFRGPRRSGVSASCCTAPACSSAGATGRSAGSTTRSTRSSAGRRATDLERTPPPPPPPPPTSHPAADVTEPGATRDARAQRSPPEPEPGARDLSERGALTSPTTTCASGSSSDASTTRLGGRRRPGPLALVPGFADTDGPLLYRRRFDGQPPTASGRAWLVLDGALLPGRRLARRRLPRRHRGLLLPPRVRGHRAAAPTATSTCCGRGRRAPARRDRTRQAQPHRRLPALGLPRPRLEPGRASGARSASTRPGPVRIAPPPRAVPRGDRGRGPAASTLLDAALDSDADRGTVTVRSPVGDGATIDAIRTSPLAARREPRRVDASTSTDPPLWWPRRSATSLDDVHVEVVVEVDGRARATGATLPHRAAPGAPAALDLPVNGERLFLKGANQGPTRMALGEATPDELRARRRPRAATPASTCCGSTPTSPGPSSTTRPTRPACCSGRTSRCSGATPGASASRRCARPARRSTCSATTRRSRSGAATTSRSPSTSTRRGRDPRRAPDAARRRRRQLPTWNKTVLDRSIKRALEKADGTRPVDRPLRRAARTRRSSTAPTATSTSAGTTATSATSPGFAARGAPPGPLRHRVRRPGRARHRRRSCEPERWPDLDWDRLGARHALQKRDLRPGTCRPPSYATFDAWRAATQAYQATLVQHHIEDLRRLKYRPTGGFGQFCFADGHPAVTWSVLDHERGRSSATRRCASVPAGDRRR